MKKELIEKTIEISNNALAPLTHFCVGAILETSNGNLYTGVNVETPSALFVLCAERNAITNAIANGETEFKRIYLYGHKEGHPSYRMIPPCGMCLQVMNELCPQDFEIILIKSEEEYEIHTLNEFLPISFARKKELKTDGEERTR